MARKKKGQEYKAESWDRFTIDTGFGKLTCTYDPEGLDEALTIRFETYLISASQPARLKRAAVEHLVGGALTEFMRDLAPALKIALDMHFETCIEKEKLFCIDSPLFKRMSGGRYKPIMGLRDSDGTILFPTIRAGKSMKSILAPVEAYLRERLVPGRGGPTERNTYFKKGGDENFKAFALTVNQCQPLWGFITKFFSKNDYDAGCPEMLKKNEKFKSLTSDCQRVEIDDLIQKVFVRKSRGGMETWPQAFAMQHACRALGISRNYKISTLYQYYKRGQRLLGNDSKPNSAKPKKAKSKKHSGNFQS